MSTWECIRGDLGSASVKQRILGLENLLKLASREVPNETQLSLPHFAEFIDICETLLTDSNFKVAQQTLHALSMLVCNEPDAIKPYANSIVPLVAERLADARQEVRQLACEVLLKLLAALKPENVIPRLARFWTHRSWKVRHGLLQTIAEAVSAGIPGVLNHKNQNSYIITQVVNLVEDPNETVRDASLDCLQELFRALGTVLVDNLSRQSIRPAALRQVVARLDEVAPCNITVPEPSPSAKARKQTQEQHIVSSSVHAVIDSHLSEDAVTVDVVVPAGSTKPGPKRSSVSKEAAAEPPTAVVTLSSERELASELEGMSTLLATLAADWQQRIAAMVRLEGIAKGSPLLMDALNDMLKGLREPLMRQIEDRRSAVNKQACQTLATLSSVFGIRFQDHAIYFLPVLFKVLPITVQVMAEASDSCCRAILQSCQSHRLLPVLVQTASKDKNPKIRQLCCGYIAEIMETWDIAVSMRCSDDLEAAIQAAIQDSAAEARLAARRAYAAYASKASEHAAAFLNRLEPGLRDKLAKGGATDGRKAAAARPRIPIRKPSAAFAAAAAASAQAVLVYTPERVTVTKVLPSVEPDHVAAPQAQPASRPPARAPVHSAGGAAAAPERQAPPQRLARRSSAAAELPSAPYAMPTASGIPTGAALKPPLQAGPSGSMAAPERQALTQRAPYRGSSAAELPPMDKKPQTAGGRKSLGFGPSRVPGFVEPGEGSLAHLLFQGIEANSQKPKSRRSTGGIGAMVFNPATGSATHQAVRIPSSDAPPPSPPAASLDQAMQPASPARRVTADNSVYTASAAGAGFGSPAAARRVTDSMVFPASAAPSAAAAGRGVAGGVAAGPPGSFRSWGSSSGGGGATSSNNSSGGDGVAPVGVAMAVVVAGQQQPSAKQGITKVVATLMSAPRSWNEKVEALNSLVGLLEQAAASASDSGRDQCCDYTKELERGMPKLVECIEDSHHKVSIAALEAVKATIHVCPHALDVALERTIPAVFQRTSDARDSTRALAASVLSECSKAYNADVLLLGLTRSLEACKVPKTKVAVLEFSYQHLGQGRPAGIPSNANQTRQWLRLLCPLLSDKHPDVRRAATEAVEGLYQLVDAGLVVSFAASHANAAEAVALRKVIGGLADRDAMAIDSEPAPGAAQDESELALPGSAFTPPAGDLDDPRSQQGFAEAQRHQAPLVSMELPASPQLFGMPACVADETTASGRVDHMEGLCFQHGDDAAFAFPALRQAGSPQPAAASTSHDASQFRSQQYLQHQPQKQQPPFQRSKEPAAAAMEPQAAARHVSLLMHRLQSAPSEEAFARLADTVPGLPASAWEGHLSQLAQVMAKAAGGTPQQNQQQQQQQQTGMKEAALRLAHVLAVDQPALLHGFLDVVVPSLLTSAADSSTDVANRLVAKAAYDTLAAVLDTAPSSGALGLLGSQLPNASAAAPPDEVLAVIVKCLQGVIRSMPHEELTSRGLPLLAPGLVQALQHPRADIRKNAVFCLVEMWCRLDEALVPHLAGLTVAQRRLLDGYCTRAAAGLRAGTEGEAHVKPGSLCGQVHQPMLQG